MFSADCSLFSSDCFVFSADCSSSSTGCSLFSSDCSSIPPACSAVINILSFSDCSTSPFSSPFSCGKLIPCSWYSTGFISTLLSTSDSSLVTLRPSSFMPTDPTEPGRWLNLTLAAELGLEFGGGSGVVISSSNSFDESTQCEKTVGSSGSTSNVKTRFPFPLFLVSEWLSGFNFLPELPLPSFFFDLFLWISFVVPVIFPSLNSESPAKVRSFRRLSRTKFTFRPAFGIDGKCGCNKYVDGSLGKLLWTLCTILAMSVSVKRGTTKKGCPSSRLFLSLPGIRGFPATGFKSGFSCLGIALCFACFLRLRGREGNEWEDGGKSVISGFPAHGFPPG